MLGAPESWAKLLRAMHRSALPVPAFPHEAEHFEIVAGLFGIDARTFHVHELLAVPAVLLHGHAAAVMPGTIARAVVRAPTTVLIALLPGRAASGQRESHENAPPVEIAVLFTPVIRLILIIALILVIVLFCRGEVQSGPVGGERPHVGMLRDDLGERHAGSMPGARFDAQQPRSGSQIGGL